MKLPPQLGPVLWGAAGGAAILAILGFTSFGWVTASLAEHRAEDRASAAVVAALTSICVDKFRADLNAAKNLVALKSIEFSWTRANYIEKGGWATMSGEKRPYDGVAGACAQALLQNSMSSK